ncbi:hypothetical protein ACH5RR_008450 [Cinchona calisaya]|uniref:Uncharacterized protein n=1 Tax=Cinchona calisaya TaxID=153742 RepID=A0ABD3AH83_9GENT
MARKQKERVNLTQEDQDDIFVEEINSENDDTFLDQPIGGLMARVRHHWRKPKINVHVPPIDYGVKTMVVAQVFSSRRKLSANRWQGVEPALMEEG